MDKIFMARAIELAKRGESSVNPNPLVGAVVVKNNKIIGEGWHKKYGGAHAEVFALDEAGKEAEGATIYINLEPCSHFGKTPPCVDKIIKSGIKKCCIAISDPNPLVSGKSIKLLKEAKIEVEVGILEKEAYELNRVFFKYIKDKIPFLFLKCGITLDGKIATRTGDSKWITNNLAREKVQELRSKYMGIMVGINTVLKDNPSLNSRKYNARNPYRIVIDPKLKIKNSSKVLHFNDNKAIIITSEKNIESREEKIEELKKLGINFIFLSGYDFKIKEILENLGKLGIDSIILEGGSYLISKAFSEEIIDGGEIFIAPKIIGDNKALSFIDGFSFEDINSVFNLPNSKFNIYGDNISIEFYK